MSSDPFIKKLKNHSKKLQYLFYQFAQIMHTTLRLLAVLTKKNFLHKNPSRIIDISQKRNLISLILSINVCLLSLLIKTFRHNFLLH